MSVRRAPWFVIVFCFLLASRLSAATLTVTSLADSGPGSLRDTIALAEAGDTIEIAVTGVITLSTASTIGTALVITRDLTIDGGTSGVTIARDTTDPDLNLRLFLVDRGITVRMRNLTLMNGLASGGNGTGRAGGGAGFGGAIYNGGALLLENMTFSENWAVGGTSVSGGPGAGGFPNGGTLCNVAGFGGGSARNPSCGSTPGFGGGGGGSSLGGGGAGMGGAVFNDNGSLVIVNSTFSANHAQGGEPGGSNGLGGAGLGGALFSLNDTMAIVNSTFVGNTVSAFQVGPADLTNGGSIYVLGFDNPASLTLNNTIIAGPSPDVETLYTAFVGTGTVSSSGAKNIIETIGGLGFAGESVSVDPLLGPLAMNGGPTPTHRPLPGSPATNAGHYNLAVFPNGEPITTDQRGYPRMGSFQVDIGAYESQPPTLDLPIVFITAGTTQTGVFLAQAGDVDGPEPVTTPIFALQSGSGISISNVAVSAEGRITGTVQALCGAVGSNFTVELQDAEGNVARAGLQVRLNGSLALVAVPEPFTQTRQYSDPIAPILLEAIAPDAPGSGIALTMAYTFNGGAAQPGLPAGLTLSPTTNNGAQTPGRSGWVVTGTAAAPGAYTIIFNVVSGCVTRQAQVALTVTAEDARAAFTGPVTVSTTSATNGAFSTTLSATVRDISAADPAASAPAPDTFAGDIRTATVKFVNRATNATLCTATTLTLVNAADSRAATASCTWSATLGTSTAQIFTIGTVVGASYTRASANDDVYVTVAKPVATGLVWGSASLLNKRSTGLIAGRTGLMTDLAVALTYTKQAGVSQGSVTVRVRGACLASGTPGPESVCLYEIRTSQFSLLARDDKAKTAVFGAKASIVDVTGAAPVAVASNLTLLAWITDAGTADKVAIQVMEGTNRLWFSTNWAGWITDLQTIASGNLTVR